MKEIQHKTKRSPEALQIPNLVELQLESYKWFLCDGLKELFHSFSPIHDFTGNMSLEMMDYELGEPKYTVEECRYRDMTTYEAPIKARVRLTQAGKEVIESEVYLGDLPLMTDKGTFVINGAERVVVSQLARSPGVYFRDTLDPSGRVVYFATIIPSPGAWIEAETDRPIESEPHKPMPLMVHVAQTRKFPLTTLLRSLNLFAEACPDSESVPVQEAYGRVLKQAVMNPEAVEVVDKATGEVIKEASKKPLLAAGKTLDDKDIKKLAHAHVVQVEVEAPGRVCGTTIEILDLFGSKEVVVPDTLEKVRGRRPTADVLDGDKKVIVRAGENIMDDSAKRIVKLGLTEMEVYRISPYLHATLCEDNTHTAEEALIDLHKRIRPGEPATRDSAVQLMNSYFFDTRRYDLARVGRYKINKKLGLRLPERVRCVTREDILKTIEYLIGLSENGSMVSSVNYPGLFKRLPEIEAAFKAMVDAATEEEKIIGGKLYSLGVALDSMRNITTGDVFTEEKIEFLNELLDLVPNGRRLLSTGPADLNSDTIVRLAPCSVDDIDHLQNKRVRSVGELLQDQLRMGFLRMEKVAKERMTSVDPENVVPQLVLSVKPISASIKSFFGSSQLSQFMDQTNPLAELTHKRRLSALGPGGLSRQSAKLEVRDVHYSHYSRICPIETPEGPNIGLIGSMAVHAKVDPYGFLRTPYRVVKQGKVTDEIYFMPADEEIHEYMAPASTPYDPETMEITLDRVVVRHENTYPQVDSKKVTFLEVSPMQIMSVAAALIPFLENDDANRALMGSNMQRQAVPLLRAEAPLVGTGLEKRAARDSGAMIIAKNAGTVRFSDAGRIVVEREDGMVDSYTLMHILRSNQGTCITQRPNVEAGDKVRAGDVLAEGPCTDTGELALGKNILVAFMPWNGYNYEDAVLLSERLVKDDTFSSIHVEKYETEARDTKLGPEEITRDIPNVGEDVLRDLDDTGVIRIGAEVRAEDILVGKVAPKGQSELTAEERLIIAIFGKKAEETRDVSLRVPHGESGTIVDVKVFSRFKYKCERCATVFDFSKKPESLVCTKCDGDMKREPGDELNAGVNQLVRVYIAQKRKIMEGDKMAGRHGNKGVISRILPEADMPFLPDGTAVDVVLNPLGVPSRMNIGQILETHQGIVGHHLGCRFKNPIFQAATEFEILADMEILARKIKIGVLRNYVKELHLSVDMPTKRRVDATINKVLTRLPDTGKADLPALLKPILDLYDECKTNILETIKKLDAAELETLSFKLSEQPAVDDPDAVREAVCERLRVENEARIAASMEDNTEADVVVEQLDIPFTGQPAPTGYDYDALITRIEQNAHSRYGFDHKTGKSILFDGRSGQKFSQEVTVGQIYMMKLAHLVEDKIHARSTGPYSLVTQQPLGGKAQFGGQRFGEMEVWALEAYGAAYTLQEILTIKSDDVQGRVKTYESIVKGESIMEPGVPESFKILINELRSLCLKVIVEDDKDHAIDLRDTEEEHGSGRESELLGAKRRKKLFGFREDFND